MCADYFCKCYVVSSAAPSLNLMVNILFLKNMICLGCTHCGTHPQKIQHGLFHISTKFHAYYKVNFPLDF